MSNEIHPTEAACRVIENWFLTHGRVPPTIAAKLAIIREAIPKPVRSWLKVDSDSVGSRVIVRSENAVNERDGIEISRCESDSDSHDSVNGLYVNITEGRDESCISFSMDEAERVEVIRDSLTAWLDSPDAFETFAKGLA